MLLRRSVRALFASIWPADKAVENSENAQAIAELWAAMARQGLSSLGGNLAEGGLREILLVFEELGSASCPAPLLGAIAANLVLTTQASNAARAMLDDLHQGKAMIALALGDFDGDAAAGAVARRGETVQGKLSFVEGAQTATHLLIFTASPPGLAVVGRDAPGLAMRATPGLAVPALCRAHLE